MYKIKGFTEAERLALEFSKRNNRKNQHQKSTGLREDCDRYIPEHRREKRAERSNSRRRSSPRRRERDYDTGRDQSRIEIESRSHIHKDEQTERRRDHHDTKKNEKNEEKQVVDEFGRTVPKGMILSSCLRKEGKDTRRR
jgi:hypothetical protein